MAGRLAAEFRAGIGYLLSVRVLVIMTVMQIIVNLCLAAEKLMFFYAKDTLGLGAAGVAIVVAAGGAGGAAGALSASWLAARIGQIRLVVLTVAASGLAIGSVSVTDSLVTLAVANLAYLWAITVASLANRTYRQLIVPREHARPGDQYGAAAVPHRRPGGRGRRGLADGGPRRTRARSSWARGSSSR